MKSDLLYILEDAEAIILPEYENALVGHSVGANPKAIYDVHKMIKKLISEDGMTYDEAWEWLEYNTFPSFHPNQKINHPIFFYPF
tara:strand:- start:503 stop:757 length:255 start_codon:yes stop_codon:yes gene_type:complete